VQALLQARVPAEALLQGQAQVQGLQGLPPLVAAAKRLLPPL
jgi:hypothetical protein